MIGNLAAKVNGFFILLMELSDYVAAKENESK